MEILTFALAVAIIALIAYLTRIILFNRHFIRHLCVTCRGRSSRRGVLQALADGIMFR